LALAILASFYEFDVERAFSGYPIERQQLEFQGGALTLFLGINDQLLKQVRYFAASEIWPFTPKGLFLQMKSRQEIPLSLKQAFCLTSHYFLIKRAFGRALKEAISDELLFELLVGGEWEEVEQLKKEIENSSLAKAQEKALELGPFLLSRVMQRSKSAAHLMIFLEKEFALKRLNNEELELLISLLDPKSVHTQPFLEAVGGGIRSNQLALRATQPVEHPKRRYVVEPGDSLWKISRKFDVKIEVIKELNGAKAQRLRPGVELFLPPKEAGHCPLSAKDDT